MGKRLFFLTMVISFYLSLFCYKNCYITTRHHPGRFGDQLILYSKAKLLSHMTGIPFLYKPFLYSEELVLSTIDQRYAVKKVKGLKTVSVVDALSVVRDAKSDSCLFVVGFFSQVLPCSPLILKKCMDELRMSIAPKKELWQPSIPSNRISVAMHIRTGGDYTLDGVAQYFFMHKFLSHDFYSASLKSLIALFPAASFYVHVFTDDPDPLALIDSMRAACGLADIVFDCRAQGNHHDQNVLEDFFAMTHFDCLIRSGSSFSRMAEVLGGHKIVISSSGMRQQITDAQRLERVLDTPGRIGQLAGVLNLFSWIRT